MAAASQLRSRSEWERNMIVEDSRRILFPSAVVGLSSAENNSPGLNFSNVNANISQAKPEFREAAAGGSLELTTTTRTTTEDSDQGSLGRKRRPEQELSQTQMGSYLLQSSTGSIPASHASIPATFWAMSNGGGGGNGADPLWAIPSNNSNMYRGAMSDGGIHFMNFAASPLMPLMAAGQQLGSANGTTMVTESNLGMLAALNAYRPVRANGLSETTAAAASNQQHPDDGGDHEGHERHS